MGHLDSDFDFESLHSAKLNFDKENKEVNRPKYLAFNLMEI